MIESLAALNIQHPEHMLQTCPLLSTELSVLSRFYKHPCLCGTKPHVSDVDIRPIGILIKICRSSRGEERMYVKGRRGYRVNLAWQ